MRVRSFIFISTLFIIVLFSGITLAQEDSTCELDAAEIVTVIESVCSSTGNNELCYGNNDVAVASRDNAPDIDFSSPGDIMSINYVQSLYLSALDQAEDIWGVAQMRLVTTTSKGPQEVTLLLYGDVEVDNAVEPTTTIIVSTTASINIRSIPRLNGAVLSSAPRGTELEAVGRLEDSSWIRVIVPETEAVGWLSSDFIEVVDDDFSLDMLDIMESDDTYFGPMQAFYINTGTNLSCDNVATDGLIIQTPEGTARVTILINEVSIELVSPADGSATAVITANTIDGMTVNVVNGTAVVSANNSSYHVGSGFSTNIGLNDDMTPSGPVSTPGLIDSGYLLDIPLLDGGGNVINPINIIDAGGNNISNGTGNDSGNTVTSSGTTTGTSSGTTTGTTDGTGTSTGTTDGTATNSNSNGNANGNANGIGNANGND